MRELLLIILAVSVSLILSVSVTACTDAKLKQITTIGSAGHIVCYSGGKTIYEGDSTGKIATEQGSDGWFLEDANTHKLVRVSGDCVITN